MSTPTTESTTNVTPPQPVWKSREDDKHQKIANRHAFFARVLFWIRVVFFDRVVRRAAHLVETLCRVRERQQEYKTSPATHAEAEAIRVARQRAWIVFFMALVAGTADVFCVLPNIGYALAARFAGGGAPAPWQKVAAFVILETVILFLLLAAKALSNVQPHVEVIRKATDDPTYDAARRRYFGARVALVGYIVVITLACGSTFIAEVNKVSIEGFLKTSIAKLQSAEQGPGSSVSLNEIAVGPPLENDRKAESNPVFQGISVPIVTSALIFIWALHLCILFMPPGHFTRRGLLELTLSELGRIERRQTHQRDQALLRINARLQTYIHDPERYQKLLDRIPAAVRLALRGFMAGDSAEEPRGEDSATPGSEPTPVAPPAGANAFIPLPPMEAYHPALEPDVIFKPSKTGGADTAETRRSA